MASFLADHPDLLFYLERGIDWSPLVELTEFDYRTPDGFKNRKEAFETYRDILEVIGPFVAEEVAPYAQQIDREGVRFEKGVATFGPRMNQIFESIAALELHGMCLPRELEARSQSSSWRASCSPAPTSR